MNMTISKAALSLGFLFAVSCLSSCSPEGLPLESDGELSAVERKNITAIDPNFSYWQPGQSVWWKANGVVRHICIGREFFVSLTAPREVFVFDSTGALLEANYLCPPNPSCPLAVHGISPLKVSFGIGEPARFEGKNCPGGAVVLVGMEYTPEEAQKVFSSHREITARIKGVSERFEASGGKDSKILSEMIDAELTQIENERKEKGLNLNGLPDGMH